MTSLRFVKASIEKGKTDDALHALRRILYYEPSAEAHYIAAKLANSQKRRQKHLEAALDMNPFYEPAARMLERLEYDWTPELNEIRQELEKPKGWGLLSQLLPR